MNSRLENTALIVVDIQNDFVKGSLATDPDEKYVAKTARWIQENKEKYPLIITTQDWHVGDETDHIKQWGEHCMSNTEGALIHADILKALKNKKGKDLSIRFYKGHYDHGYSGFEGIIQGASTGNLHPDDTLNGFLKDRSIEQVHIIGIATDHCVRATAIDAVKNGFKTVVLSEYVNGVSEEESQKLLEGGFQKHGIEVE